MRCPRSRPTIYRDRLERLRARATSTGTTGSSSTPTASTAPTSPTSPASTPASRRRCSSSAPAGEPAILVGNECYGMAGAAPLPMRRHLFQDFSLPGQPRDRSRPLAEILAEEGIARDSRVGVIGWKEYAEPRDDRGAGVHRRRAAPDDGPTGSVENAAPLLIDAADGLRVINEVEQLAAFEYAACQTSNGVRQLLFGLEPGMTRAGGRPAARVERHAALVPPDAVERRPGIPRAAQPGRPTDRTRRPVHGRVRHLGSA